MYIWGGHSAAACIVADVIDVFLKVLVISLVSLNSWTEHFTVAFRFLINEVYIYDLKKVLLPVTSHYHSFEVFRIACSSITLFSFSRRQGLHRNMIRSNVICSKWEMLPFKTYFKTHLHALNCLENEAKKVTETLKHYL